MTILAAEAWATHAELWRDHAAELSPDVAERLEAASHITAEQVNAAAAQAQLWDAELAAAFEQVDLLALPTLADAPPTLEDAGRLTDIRYVAPFNLTGVPAISLPVPTRGPSPVPASLQLVGPAGSEELLLATAASLG
jgi:amidase